MIITKSIEIDKHWIMRLRYLIMDVFDTSVTDENIPKLISLDPHFIGLQDTMDEDRLMNAICKHFTGMEVPMYGSTQEYKDKFHEEVKNKKSEFQKFIYNK